MVSKSHAAAFRDSCGEGYSIIMISRAPSKGIQQHSSIKRSAKRHLATGAAALVARCLLAAFFKAAKVPPSCGGLKLTAAARACDFSNIWNCSSPDRFCAHDRRAKMTAPQCFKISTIPALRLTMKTPESLAKPPCAAGCWDPPSRQREHHT